MLYAFILGKNTALSVAEIIAVLKRERFVFVSLSITSKALIIKVDKKIDNPQALLNGLGGTIKIVEIFDLSPREKIIPSILDFIENNFKQQKFIFGISDSTNMFPGIGIKIKNELKNLGLNSRFIRGKEGNLSAPEIKNNRIMSHGADVAIINYEQNYYLGRTIAIQDYESYSYRDYDRPRRNAKSGMLPPKLAQIMLNLIPTYNLQLTRLLLIYDPFCGQGTILQEALLMGLKAIGSDISPERVYDTKQNLSWLSKNYDLKIDTNKIVFQEDASNLKAGDLPAEPDAIVSEVYLGPPLTERVSEKEILDIIKNLEKEYERFLKSSQLLDNTSLVLALPFYKLKNKLYFLNIIDEAKKIGYNVIDPFENMGISFDLLLEYQRERKTILYSRPDQLVGREIIILGKS